MKSKAVEYFFNQGYSCSEAVVKAAADVELVNQNLVPLATPFSGGISSGCLCGAIAGMELVIGAVCGRHDNSESSLEAKNLAKQSIIEFKERNKYTCCRALTAGMSMASSERKEHCCKMVCDAAEILERLLIKEKI